MTCIYHQHFSPLHPYPVFPFPFHCITYSSNSYLPYCYPLFATPPAAPPSSYLSSLTLYIFLHPHPAHHRQSPPEVTSHVPTSIHALVHPLPGHLPHPPCLSPHHPHRNDKLITSPTLLSSYSPIPENDPITTGLIETNWSIPIPPGRQRSPPCRLLPVH